MITDSFGYKLPEELIAQNPVYPRDGCRLMVLDRNGGSIYHGIFNQLPKILKKGDVLVLNKSKVIPARILVDFGGKEIEILISRKLNDTDWQAMVRPGKLFKVGFEVNINKNLSAKVMRVEEDGQRTLRFSTNRAEQSDALAPLRRCASASRASSIGKEIDKALDEAGQPPYPPYIKDTEADFDDYQTVFAKDKGSIAAPTAGIHFTDRILNVLEQKGVRVEFLTLHVGLGTFLPIKSKRIEDHRMHNEVYELSNGAATALNLAKDEGRRVIAVGTTSVRVLESSFSNGRFYAGRGETDIFIYPGYEWKCVDGLITNFHLPKSTLILLASSFAGKDFIFKAYEEAIKLKYRFYSFGDAMLIL